MSSAFAAIFAVADGIIDRQYAESFTVTPKADKPGDPNARKVAAIGLAAVTFQGVWDEPRTKVYAHNDEGHRDAATSKVGANKPTIDFQLSAVPYPILKDYQIARLKDGSAFTVSDVTPDGLTRATISLTAARGY